MNKQDLLDALEPHYAELIFTADQAAVVEALRALRHGSVNLHVAKALLVLARAHSDAEEMVGDVEGYVALAWRESQS